MPEIFFGPWSVRVRRVDASFEHRSVISGADAGDGVYPAVAGAEVCDRCDAERVAMRFPNTFPNGCDLTLGPSALDLTLHWRAGSDSLRDLDATFQKATSAIFDALVRMGRRDSGRRGVDNGDRGVATVLPRGAAHALERRGCP
jgi:hypothetical protein